MLLINLYLGLVAFFLKTFPRNIYTILYNRPCLILLVTFWLDLRITLFFKSIMQFEPFGVNVNFTPVPVFQGVQVVRSIFFHAHVSFSARPLFTTVNFVLLETAAHHLCRVLPFVYCATSIPRHFSYQRHKNVTSFPLPSFTQTFIGNFHLLRTFGLFIN